LNRALRRCRGEIIGSIDAAIGYGPRVATAAAALRRTRTRALLTGACDMVDAAGEGVASFLPAEFDVLGLWMDRSCRRSIVVLFPTAVRRALYFDEDFRWCRTFAVLRLAHLRVVRSSTC